MVESGKGRRVTAIPARDVPTQEAGDVRALPPAAGAGQVHAGKVHVGSVIGRYVVIDRLGAGGMGVVYAAFDPDLDRKVAIKLLPAQHDDTDRERREERLTREAKAIAKLSHPNIVAIHDVGVHDEQVFLAMEHLGGGTLRQWLSSSRRPWRQVLRVFLDAGRGLAAAHAEHLIHRDFKPENVLLDRNGVAKVADFGLVRLSEPLSAEDGPAPAADLLATPETLTRTGALMGTPAYMAPEQFSGRAVDARADQFAFSVALYEALYGERPFPGDSVAALAASVTAGQVRPAPPASPVPGWIRKALLRGLAAEPDRRHATMGELLEALGRDPAARRRRVLGGTAAVAMAVVAGLILQRRLERERRQFEAGIAMRLAEGERAWDEARHLGDELEAQRRQTFALFDAQDREGGERVWTAARATSEAFEAHLDRAQHALESALAMDQARADTRRRLAEVLFARAANAERELRREDVARHVAALDAVDTSGDQRRRWRQPGMVTIETEPPGAQVAVERYQAVAGGRLAAVSAGAPLVSPVAAQRLAPGSYRLHIQMAGRADTLVPFVVERGEARSLRIPLPRADELPPDFRYIPAGRFFYGDHDEEWRVAFLNAAPLHERTQPAFLIKAHETTFAEWIAFLDALPRKERLARMPANKAVQATVLLAEPAPGAWKLSLNISHHLLEAWSGHKLAYVGRPAGASVQDWLKFPVISVSPLDVRAYVEWLSSTGRVPGARLCRDSEWERAARGADERAYPASLSLLNPQDANIDATYGRIAGAYGPDEVGRHPVSRSPFGIDDMAGNAWEITEDDDRPGSFLIRGGGFYHAGMSARSTNREPIEPETRHHNVGVRVCADWPRTTQRGNR